jgi:hypothetical protein
MYYDNVGWKARLGHNKKADKWNEFYDESKIDKLTKVDKLDNSENKWENRK